MPGPRPRSGTTFTPSFLDTISCRKRECTSLWAKPRSLQVGGSNGELICGGTFWPKCRNKQYLWINGFEAPLLAMVLSMFMRFSQPGLEYSFRASENVPPFLFISVIVALFLGLSISAEEVLRDRKLLRREAFLHVKWLHYVHAKMAVVAAVTLFHAIGFVAVSHAMSWTCQPSPWSTFWCSSLWDCLAASWVCSFRACSTPAKVVYILIPLLVIPPNHLRGSHHSI